MPPGKRVCVNQLTKMTSRRVAVCLVFTCFPLVIAALEEKKNAVRLAFFFWAVIRLSASMRALFIIFYLRTFFWGGCGSRSLIDAFCYTAYGRMGQREPWALAYSLLDIINLGVL